MSWIKCLNYNNSLSHVILSFIFGQFLIKVHIHVKEIHWKYMIRKISKLSLLTHYPFSLIKIHTNEKRFLRFLWEMFYYIFYPFRSHFEYLTQLFNVIIWVLQWLFLCKIPVDIFIFGCVLKPEALWSVSKTNNLDFSHFNRWI